MAFPRALAKFNRYVTNPVARLVSGKIPPFAIVVNRGRKSGRVYRTPVWVFQRGDTYRIALTYGRDSDWVRNITAAGTFELVTKGRTVRLADPVVEHDSTASWAPPGVRQWLRVARAEYSVVSRPAA